MANGNANANASGGGSSTYYIIGVLVVLSIIVAAYFLLRKGNDPDDGDACTPTDDETVDNADTYVVKDDTCVPDTCIDGYQLSAGTCELELDETTCTPTDDEKVDNADIYVVKDDTCVPDTCIDGYAIAGSACVECDLEDNYIADDGTCVRRGQMTPEELAAIDAYQARLAADPYCGPNPCEPLGLTSTCEQSDDDKVNQVTGTWRCDPFLSFDCVNGGTDGMKSDKLFSIDGNQPYPCYTKDDTGCEPDYTFIKLTDKNYGICRKGWPSEAQVCPTSPSSISRYIMPGDTACKATDVSGCASDQVFENNECLDTKTQCPDDNEMGYDTKYKFLKLNSNEYTTCKAAPDSCSSGYHFQHDNNSTEWGKCNQTNVPCTATKVGYKNSYHLMTSIVPNECHALSADDCADGYEYTTYAPDFQNPSDVIGQCNIVPTTKPTGYKTITIMNPTGGGTMGLQYKDDNTRKVNNKLVKKGKKIVLSTNFAPANSYTDFEMTQAEKDACTPSLAALAGEHTVTTNPDADGLFKVDNYTYPASNSLCFFDAYIEPDPPAPPPPTPPPSTWPAVIVEFKNSDIYVRIPDNYAVAYGDKTKILDLLKSGNRIYLTGEVATNRADGDSAESMPTYIDYSDSVVGQMVGPYPDTNDACKGRFEQLKGYYTILNVQNYDNIKIKITVTEFASGYPSDTRTGEIINFSQLDCYAVGKLGGPAN